MAVNGSARVHTPDGDAGEFLRLTDVHAHYGESHILHGVDLTVRKGEVVTLLGRNGAGRTTTLKSILGLVGRRAADAGDRPHS